MHTCSLANVHAVIAEVIQGKNTGDKTGVVNGSDDVLGRKLGVVKVRRGIV